MYASSGFVCGLVAIAIVHLVLFQVLNVSLCLVVHRFHNLIDICIFWICLWVGGHSHGKYVSVPGSLCVVTCSVHRFHKGIDFCIFWICLWVGGHSHRKYLSVPSSEYVVIFRCL